MLTVAHTSKTVKQIDNDVLKEYTYVVSEEEMDSLGYERVCSIWTDSNGGLRKGLVSYQQKKEMSQAIQAMALEQENIYNTFYFQNNKPYFIESKYQREGNIEESKLYLQKSNYQNMVFIVNNKRVNIKEAEKIIINKQISRSELILLLYNQVQPLR